MRKIWMLALMAGRHRSLPLTVVLTLLPWVLGCAGLAQSPGGNNSTPLSVSSVATTGISSETVTVIWTTNKAASSQVEYGTTASYGQSTALNASLVTSHSAGLSGLTASTVYHYRVKSTDASNNQAASADFTFTTSMASVPLTISSVAASGISASSATITWTTSAAASSQVEYGTTASYGQSTALNTSLVTSHSASLSGLSASTLYHYRVKSTDASNNQAPSEDFTFTTSTASAPLTVSSVAASGISASSATVIWTTSAAASSQVEYGTTASYGQGTVLNTSFVTSHSASLSGLSASTLYHYRVKSTDASNNQATSADFTFTTTALSQGSLAVAVINPLSGSTAGGTVATTASASDNVPILGVQYQLDGLNIGPLFREAPYTYFWDTSLAVNGSHTLGAVARDISGNTATSSSIALTIRNDSSTMVNLDPSNWCSGINGAAPGKTLILALGSYTDSCHITASGTASLPITIRSQSSATASRAALQYNGTTSNVIDLSGSYIAIRWLTLGPSQDGVDGIRIRGAHDDVIEENIFQKIGGVGVPNNDSGGNTPRISIRNNIFNDGQSTVIYLGCHDGFACHSPDALVEGNLIIGAQPGDGVGSGVQIKLNSYATVRDNSIYNTTGAGIIIYGSNEGDPASIVEGNYVEGAQQDAGINTAGGPAVARNNVVIGNGNFGIWAQDYNGRNLQTNVWLVGNTVLNNQGGGVGVQNWQTGRGNVLAYNAITPVAGTAGYDPSAPGTILGNVVCTPATSCFDQPSTEPFDLWPLVGGPLIGAAGTGMEPWRPFDDFMGVLRGGALADVGAFQRTGSGGGPPVGAGQARPPRQ